MEAILLTIISHSHFLICEDSRDIDRTSIIIQDLISDDQAVRQLINYLQSIILSRKFYSLLFAQNIYQYFFTFLWNFFHGIEMESLLLLNKIFSNDLNVIVRIFRTDYKSRIKLHETSVLHVEEIKNDVVVWIEKRSVSVIRSIDIEI